MTRDFGAKVVEALDSFLHSNASEEDVKNSLSAFLTEYAELRSESIYGVTESGESVDSIRLPEGMYYPVDFQGCPMVPGRTYYFAPDGHGDVLDSIELGATPKDTYLIYASGVIWSGDGKRVRE